MSVDFDPLPAAPPHEPENLVPERASPIEAFHRYVPEHLLTEIAIATSQRILSNTNKTLVVTVKMLKQFLGMNIVMSYTKYLRIRMYWARKTRVPQIADCLSRDTFFTIRSNLTLRDYLTVSQEEKANNKFWKIDPILKCIRSACLENPRTQCLSIDEQMIPFHGHTNMRQYVRGKPNPLGIKNFVCCSPDGLPIDFFSLPRQE